MRIIEYFINIENRYVLLILLTIFTIVLKKIIMFLLKRLFVKIRNNRLQFKLIQFCNIITTICEVLIIYLLWEKNIKNIITLISFISAAITLSLKDIIFNFISGIYIKINKPFNIEDRIEINGYKGDVIKLGTFSFELLEIEEEFGNQSSGVVLELPNSIIFSHPLKNLNKGFKFVWNEISVNLELDSDLVNCKNILYRIVNNVDLIKNVPNKMKNELNNNTSYIMYFNKYEPVIYTEVLDNHIVLVMRYLINPKKSRIVKSYIWNEILKEYSEGNITLKK